MNSSLSDRRILSTTWEVLDRTPNPIFGYPALKVPDLYHALNTTSAILDIHRIVSVLEDNTENLLGGRHDISLKSVRQGQTKDHWIVFKPNPISDIEANEIQQKTLELLPDLPGGEAYIKKQPKSARQKIFQALGMRRNQPNHDITKTKHENILESGMLEREEHEPKGSEYRVRPKLLNEDERSDSVFGIHSPKQMYDDKAQESRPAQTEEWHQLKDERQVHEIRSNDRRQPERKGTEWDIIDSYNYGSDEDQNEELQNPQNIENTKSKGSDGQILDEIRDNREMKIRLKSKFEDEEISLNNRNLIDCDKNKYRDFEGTIGKYFDEYVADEMKEQDQEQPDESHEVVNSVSGDVRSQDRDFSGMKNEDKLVDHEQHKSEISKEKTKGSSTSKSRSRSSSEEMDRHRKEHINKADLQVKRMEDRSKYHRAEPHSRDHHQKLDAESQHHRKRNSHSKTHDSSDKNTSYPDEINTPFLIKSFKGLPFEPDLSIFDSLLWIKDGWQLLVAELVAVLGVVYIIQATGL
ncbi:uncharacterized protein I206_105098 [Kwoniella pini CBS 10737]|uniref:Uncharacterized protein n=1 Tax=Kwoniella pini CBS 10737 TaxID=1296096 RepID=A0A1B9I8K4_9TREE|nr:uncharacterized protein I206_02638 [Kwoniella pini CBS 10737]OCF51922.1 hypothetical protein I206_02638 [Kwoniella pini CBS 10737]